MAWLSLLSSFNCFNGENTGSSSPQLFYCSRVLCAILGATSVPMNMHRASVYTYCLCVGAIRSKLDGHGVEHAHLSCHLLHASHCTLLIRICKLHHQAWRGSLQDRRQKETHKWIRQVLAHAIHTTNTDLAAWDPADIDFAHTTSQAFWIGPLQEAKSIRKERTDPGGWKTEASIPVPSFLQNSNFQAVINVRSAKVVALFFQHIENLLVQ